MSDPDRTDAPTRVVVRGGGEPTPEELAALVVALAPVAAPGAPSSTPSSRWVRAALLEGTGAGPFASPADVDAHAAGFPHGG